MDSNHRGNTQFFRKFLAKKCFNKITMEMNYVVRIFFMPFGNLPHCPKIKPKTPRFTIKRQKLEWCFIDSEVRLRGIFSARGGSAFGGEGGLRITAIADKNIHRIAKFNLLL